jgi:hypothetical protein
MTATQEPVPLDKVARDVMHFQKVLLLKAIIEAVGLKQFIEAVGVNRIVEAIGVERLWAGLLPEQREELRRIALRDNPSQSAPTG